MNEKQNNLKFYRAQLRIANEQYEEQAEDIDAMFDALIKEESEASQKRIQRFTDTRNAMIKSLKVQFAIEDVEDEKPKLN